MDTKELVKLARKANLLNRLADTIESLERERDVLAKAYDGEKDASAQYRELAAAKSREKIDEFRRAEASESEAATLRARLAKMEEALRAAHTQIMFWKVTADKVPGHASSMPFIEPSAAAIEQINAALKEPKP